jgi:Domain of unknown function (DUF4399)
MLLSALSRTQLFVVLIIGGLATAFGENAAPSNASVYIINPKDGDTVTNPFRVQFGLSNMGVAPAGVDKPNTGHHHLLIDANEPLDPNEPIPQDKTHLHFGAGQTEALVELPPGRHTLQLVLGDWSHLPFHPPIMSDVITITVK